MRKNAVNVQQSMAYSGTAISKQASDVVKTEALIEDGSQCDVDTLDCIRSVLQTVLPDEKITLTNDTCLLQMFTNTCDRKTSTLKRDPRKPLKDLRNVPSDKTKMSTSCKTSHLNPEAPSFNYYCTQPTVIMTVPVTFSRAVPMTFAPTTTAATTQQHKSPRLRHHQTSSPPRANVMWTPSPVTVAYAPVYDGWSNYSATRTVFPTAGLQLYGPVSYYQQPAVYVLGHGRPVHLMNNNYPLVDRRHATLAKHSTSPAPPSRSRCAAA
jgi:hypothetical protein